MRTRLVVLALLISSGARAEPTFDRAARLIERGRAAAALGDTLSALGFYRDAISASPRRGDGYVALGEQYLALQEPSRALEVFDAGARWTQRGEALWLGYYRAYKALGEDGRALEALRQLRRVEPTSWLGLCALAEEAEAHGAFIEALAARRSLLALASDAEAQRDQRGHVRALEVLLGGAEIVRGRGQCGEGVVERALGRCGGR